MNNDTVLAAISSLATRLAILEREVAELHVPAARIAVLEKQIEEMRATGHYLGSQFEKAKDKRITRLQSEKRTLEKQTQILVAAAEFAK